MNSQQAKHKDPLGDLYGEPEDPVRDWEGLIRLYQATFSRNMTLTSRKDGQDNKRPKWIFRGQRTDWQLETTLDRAFERYGIPTDEGDRRGIETKMLRSFMRKAHHYLAHEPSSDDLLEWLAIMRHYRAPTRMFDWTYSFYVAVYNAVENWAIEDDVVREGKWPAVWALDAAWLKQDCRLCEQEHHAPKGIDETRHQQNYVVKYLMETPTPPLLVYSATGFRLNPRLTAQQGTFLVQGTLAKPFSENLEASLGDDPKKHFCRICLKINGDRRDEILYELNNMHINHATLYPDLEGFAKSLERHMAYLENWDLTIDKTYDKLPL